MNDNTVKIAPSTFFKNMIKMDAIQQSILNKAFEKSLKKKPTRPNRK